MIRGSDLLYYTQNYFPDLVSGVDRKVSACDSLEIEYYTVWQVKEGPEYCTDWLEGTPSSFPETLLGKGVSSSSDHEPGSYHSPTGHAGADWYAQDYSSYMTENGGYFGDTLEIRPATHELLAWEMPEEDARYYSNGAVKRYPKVNLTEITISLDWEELVLNYLGDQNGGKAWLTYDLQSTYGHKQGDLLPILDLTGTSLDPVLDRADGYLDGKVGKIIIDLTDDAFRLWDAEAHANDKDYQIKIVNPYVRIFIWAEDPDYLSLKQFGLKYCDLSEDQMMELIRVGDLISSKFIGIPLETDKQYIQRYEDLVATIPTGETPLWQRILIGIVGAGLLIAGAYYGDPTSVYFGLEMIFMAITEKGFIDTIVQGVAAIAGVESLKDFSFYNIASWTLSPIATIINIGWFLVIMLITRSVLNKVFSGWRAGVKATLEAKALKTQLLKLNPDDLVGLSPEQVQGVLDGIRGATLEDVMELRKILQESKGLFTKYKGVIDPTIASQTYNEQIVNWLNRLNPAVKLPEVAILPVTQPVSKMIFLLPPTQIPIGWQFIEALQEVKIVVSSGAKLLGLIGFPFAPASSIGSIVAAAANSRTLMLLFRMTFIGEILLWNFAFRGGFLNFLQWGFSGLVEDNPYQWSSYYSLLNGN